MKYYEYDGLWNFALWLQWDLGQLFNNRILNFYFQFQEGKTHLRLSGFSDFETKPLYGTVAGLSHVEAQARWSQLLLFVSLIFHVTGKWITMSEGNCIANMEMILWKYSASSSNSVLQHKLFLEITIPFCLCACVFQWSEVTPQRQIGTLFISVKVVALSAKACWGQSLLLCDYQASYLNFSDNKMVVVYAVLSHFCWI